MTMDPAAAILAVLGSADEPLHWTVIQDRALRAGYLDPFETPDVRGVIGRTLRDLASKGTIVKVEQGTYRSA
jgi:hypothetical protein